MNELSTHQQAAELLQQLGFKEYEARCFVALSRLPKGTAKEISQTSDVPRTRVYDAIRVLESKGIVEVQHTSPQQFRAVPVKEAVALLRQEYESRARELGHVLNDIEPAVPGSNEEETHEVWSISDSTAISNRVGELVENAQEEVVLIVGRESVFTETVADQLQAAEDSGVDVIVGAVTVELQQHVQSMLPGVNVFTSGLEWIQSSVTDPDDDTEISRLLLVDRNAILLSSVHGGEADGPESAVFGRGFDNGLVVIARRIMATGLERRDDPGKSD